MSATWIDPTGIEWPLTDISPERGYFTTAQISGWNARPYEFTLDALPRGGSEVRFIRAQEARITWPLHIYAETHTAFVNLYRSLRHAFLSTVHLRAPGRLVVARGDGSSREIECFYEDGFAGEAGENWFFANPVLTLLAPDGFWRDTTATTETRTFGAGSSFLDPFLTISSSQVLGDTTIYNPGDVEAWPDWTITGPAELVTATNNTTNMSFELDYTLTAGQTITITTLRPTVRGPAGQNLVSALNFPNAYLWPLYAGINDIEFSVAGAGAGTSIELAYRPRYAGA